MPGKIYVLGIGPGDPELLTLKAVRILREVSHVCVPKGREEGSSLALSIVKKAVDLSGKEIFEAYFPMRKTRGQKSEAGQSSRLSFRNQTDDSNELDIRWQETVDEVFRRLHGGFDMAFITIGDPAIYSTFFYLYDRLLSLDPELSIEIVPGVSSINLASARAGISLGLADEKIAVLPATYVSESEDVLRGILKEFDTVVLMKVHRVFEDVLKILGEMGITEKALYISRAGMEGEMIVKDITSLNGNRLDYFSMLIVRR